MADVEGISITGSCKKFVNSILPTAEGKTHVRDEQRPFEGTAPSNGKIQEPKGLKMKKQVTVIG